MLDGNERSGRRNILKTMSLKGKLKSVKPLLEQLPQLLPRKYQVWNEQLRSKPLIPNHAFIPKPVRIKAKQ